MISKSEFPELFDILEKEVPNLNHRCAAMSSPVFLATYLIEVRNVFTSFLQYGEPSSPSLSSQGYFP